MSEIFFYLLFEHKKYIENLLFSACVIQEKVLSSLRHIRHVWACLGSKKSMTGILVLYFYDEEEK